MSPHGPLADLQVLEIGGFESVRYCGRLLALLGATVWTVEPPEGDPLRRRPPFGPLGREKAMSLPFAHLSAGKKSVRMDLSSESGSRQLQELASACDVVVAVDETLDEWDRPLRPSPNQLWVSVGMDVPAPSSAFTRLHATVNGYLIPADKDRTARPAWPGPYAFESVHGTAIAAAVLAELRRRVGGRVDYSYQAYGLWLEKMIVPRVTTAQLTELHRWDAAQSFAGVLRCSDGFICLFVIEEHQWKGLCAMIGREDWLSDERFSDGEKRVKHQNVIQEVLIEWCSVRSAHEVIVAAMSLDVPVGRIRTIAELPDWDPLVERGYFQRRPHGFGSASVPLLPFGPGLPGRPLEPVVTSVAVDEQRAAATRSESVADEGGPLTGLRVIDLTWAAAGPGITSLMAYLGADVVKVEVRSRPDLMRIAGRQYGYGETDLDHSPSFEEIGAGKRSIELDLRDPEDAATLRDLVAAADVFVENMRPGKIEELGFSYSSISAINPAIVMCSQSATGRTRSSGIPGYAPVFWAEGGGAWMTGHQTGLPGIVRGPIDFHAATNAFIGTLALLRERDRTGCGGYVDCSAIECVVALFAVELMQLPTLAARSSNSFPGTVLNDIFPTKGDDEWVAVSVFDQDAWEAFTKLLHIDLAMPTPSDRATEPATYDAVARATLQWPAARLAEDLRREGVPAASSVSLVAALHDHDLVDRGAWQPLDYESGRRLVVGLPWSWNSQPYAIPRKAPKLGEHTEQVLAEWLAERTGS